LILFQVVYTLVYDALVNKPKLTASVSAEAVAATSFGYGYSFTGSVGFVLTLPNERLLLDETNLDKAMTTLFELATASSSDQVAAFAKRLGPAPVKAVYKWASNLVSGGLGADIHWRREGEDRAELLVQLPELRNLTQAIEETSDEATKTIIVEGELIGTDHTKIGRTFHMRIDENTDMRGYMSGEIGVVEEPQFYVAEIQVTTKTNYATDQDEVSYFMTSLRRPDGSVDQDRDQFSGLLEAEPPINLP